MRSDMIRGEVAVVYTGIANTASVLSAFEKLGLKAFLTDDVYELEEARYVVLPGVGTFAAGMKKLASDALITCLRKRVDGSRPLLAICLGFQMLFAGSEESPGVKGLGIFPGEITRYSNAVRVPQLGWNKVEASAGCRYLLDGYAYFANSYCSRELPVGCQGAFSTYDQNFVAALEYSALLACQFHPELSGDFGISIIENWINF